MQDPSTIDLGDDARLESLGYEPQLNRVLGTSTPWSRWSPSA